MTIVLGGIIGSATGSVQLIGDVIGSGAGTVATKLSPTGVSPGTYGGGAKIPIITVDVGGRITSITVANVGGAVTSVAASGGSTGLAFSGGPITSSGTLTLTGTLEIAHGGTGATSPAGALMSLLPTQSGNSGKVLTTDGSTVSWTTPATGGGSGTGTVTSVSATSATGMGLTFTGGPITSSGTLALAGTLSVANGGTGATSALAARTSLDAQVTLVSGTNIKTINGNSILGSGNIVLSGGGSTGTVTSVSATSATGMGLTFTGGPITSSGTLALAGTLSVANGGTGATTAAGALIALGAVSASSLKTINGNSLVGGGNLIISGSGTSSAPEADVFKFGAVGDGVTNDSAAFQAAIDSFGGNGGVVKAVGKFRLAATINVARHVFIVGNYEMPAGQEVTPARPETDFAIVTSGSIRVDSSATINLGPGAGLKGLIIYRYGMTFPVTDVSTYAGTAITAKGNDNNIRNCFITGFNIAYHSYLTGRHSIDRVFLDNRNCIDITESHDVSYISNCHAWPFSTFTASTSGTADILKHTRPGIAFKFYNRVDWGKFTNCFAYGYKTGFHLHNVHNVTLTGCGADNAYGTGAAHTGSVGYHILGNSADVQMIGCQAAAQALAGVLIENGATDASLTTNITNFTSWGAGQHFVKVTSGNVIIVNSDLYMMPSGSSCISVTNTASRVLVSSTSIRHIANAPVVECPTANHVELKDITVIGWSGTGNPMGDTLKSTVLTVIGSTLVIPITPASVFRVANGSNFGYIEWGYKGKEITLIFEGVSTVYNRPSTGYSTGHIWLTGSPGFTSATGSVLRLIHDGTTWVEVSRSPG